MQEPTEFSRPVDLRAIPRQIVELSADEAERAALARRFDIVSIASLSATASIEERASGVDVSGRIEAALVQSCAISGEDFPVRIASDYRLRFVPEAEYEAALADAGEEIELSSDDLDTIAYSGSSIDLGEAIAQTLALEIDPYAEGPNADAARAEYGLSTPEASGPFAALQALKKGQDTKS
ncbi:MULTISPECIES: DUF177 domain-containing protein [Pseudomonadota]|jgi:uncharacterized metal-binding protein YceD (DUF177 family)|uniref:YceD family protein n=1 Tax=Pseudomonadota TaxID=1224 RepID=UPI000769C875|nr:MULTISPECIES: DUF177 domain-containing protein [Pseudomonadota]MAF62428.1 DNA-binding protein [Blastomonas sp.]|tara:strand:+ start:126859 stop:127401 length:543 start_codon:yes stop_codon:yes gene_type:complete